MPIHTPPFVDNDISPGNRVTAAWLNDVQNFIYDDIPSENGTTLIGTKVPGSGSVLRLLSNKVNDVISVLDKGATGLGIVSDSAAFTAAGSQASHVTVIVPGPATYLIDVAPTPTGKVTWIIENGATFTGAAASYMSGSGAGRQYLDAATTTTDFASVNIRRNAFHTGGTPGYVNSAFRVDHYVGPLVTNFEWGMTSLLDNSATAGENTAGYWQAIKRTGAGPTLAGVIDMEDDSNGDPTSTAVALEIDLRANGTDTNQARIGIDFHNPRRNVIGTYNTCTYAMRLSNGGDTAAKWSIGLGVATTVDVALDTSIGTVNIAAIRMAAGHAIAWEATSQKVSYYTNGGLVYRVNGTIVHEIRDDGVVRPKSFTVAQLPSAGAVGAQAFVTDAISSARGTVVAGGGTIKIPVYDDGASWIVM